MDHPAYLYHLKKNPKEKPAHLKLAEVKDSYMRAIAFAKIDNHIPELSGEDVLALRNGQSYFSVVESFDDRLVLEVGTYFLTLENYELPEFRYRVLVRKSTLNSLVDAKLLHQYGRFARGTEKGFNYSVTEKGKEYLMKDILSSCPVKDGGEEYVHVAFKASRSFMRSPEVACRFAILGFQFFEEDLQWRTTCKVLEVKHLLHLLKSIMPSWSDMSPLFFFNETYGPKARLSEIEYKSFIEDIQRDNLDEFLHSPSFIRTYAPQLMGTFIVDQETIHKFVEDNKEINGINLFFRVYDEYVEDDSYELGQSYDESDPDDPFYEYSDKFYDDDDPFTPEERYNIENSQDK